ncbi:MAG: hypothetical protein KatS3mg087_0229 [Patescibacteria group bacterium]|nr:MAG: hypothetical protein KatS3mg087_0229 [Patescibacteria group bacterium]
MVIWKRYIDKIVVGMVFLILLWVLIWRVEYFTKYVFDEYYYAAAAVSIYEKGWDNNIPHPILGKWLIALPLYFLGTEQSWYWRVMPIIAGYIGLVLTYIFAKRLGLSWWQGLLVVICLIGSKGWYLLSRIAMLDIFVAVFTLLSGLLIYRYFEKFEFSQNYDKYNDLKLLTWIGIVTGLAGAVKISGFFIILFFYFAYLFYFQGGVRKKVFDFLYIGAVAGYTFVLVNTVLYGLDFYELLIRTWQQVVFHNSAMLPEVIRETAKGDELSVNGGWVGLAEYLFFYKVYFGDNAYSLDYAYSNNPMIAASFVGLTLLLILSLMGYVIRKIQKIDYMPVFFADKKLLFLYFFGFFQIVPWGFIPRISYIYYFVTAFPFVLLMVTYYLFRYTGWKLRVVFYTIYFVLALYQVNLMVPF